MDEAREISRKTVHAGDAFEVHLRLYRYADGEQVTRTVAAHPSSVVIVAHDDDRVWLVRQPREPVGEAGLLELPAGKIERSDASPAAAARRELAEEAGKAAARWEFLGSFYLAPGYSDEQVHLFIATDLSDVARPPAPDTRRMTVEPHPLSELDALIAGAGEACTLVGLMALQRRL
jgi:8-oxo-dGTP pyrophosphatase MutT (NUDIX family)